MKYILGLIAGTIPAVLTAWFIWTKVLGFFMSLIPPTAEYAWVGKIIVTVLVAWFGGIGIPFVVLVLGVYIAHELGK